MGVSYTCDYCGEQIDDDYRHAKILVFGSWHRDYGPDWHERHFHAENGRPCFKLVGEILEAASEPDSGRPLTPREKHQQQQREWDEHEARWRSLSMPQREHLLLELLGENRLAVSQLAAKVQEKLGRYAAHYSDVYPVLKRMHLTGELDRESEPFRRTRTRSVYFRKDMSGPIVDLERTFHESDEQESER